MTNFKSEGTEIVEQRKSKMTLEGLFIKEFLLFPTTVKTQSQK
jgi:hypothetical protein